MCLNEHVYTLPEFAVLPGLYNESEVKHRLFETHFLRLMKNDEGFNHDAHWSRIRQQTTRKKKLAGIRWLGYYNERELAKCSNPIKSKSWNDRMFGKALDRKAKKLRLITPLVAPPQAMNLHEGEPSGLNLRWGDWNASLNDTNEANISYPTYEPPNVPSYPYVPYPHPYIHYPVMGYKVGGSSRGVQDNDDDDDDMSDQYVRSEDCVESDDNMDDRSC
ncbi:hypothetical protein Tco_0226043 [Tanacetum coccineum]